MSPEPLEAQDPSTEQTWQRSVSGKSELTELGSAKFSPRTERELGWNTSTKFKHKGVEELPTILTQRRSITAKDIQAQLPAATTASARKPAQIASYGLLSSSKARRYASAEEDLLADEQLSADPEEQAATYEPTTPASDQHPKRQRMESAADPKEATDHAYLPTQLAPSPELHPAELGKPASGQTPASSLSNSEQYAEPASQVASRDSALFALMQHRLPSLSKSAGLSIVPEQPEPTHDQPRSEAAPTGTIPGHASGLDMTEDAAGPEASAAPMPDTSSAASSSQMAEWLRKPLASDREADRAGEASSVGYATGFGAKQDASATQPSSADDRMNLDDGAPASLEDAQELPNHETRGAPFQEQATSVMGQAHGDSHALASLSATPGTITAQQQGVNVSRIHSESASNDVPAPNASHPGQATASQLGVIQDTSEHLPQDGRAIQAGSSAGQGGVNEAYAEHSTQLREGGIDHQGNVTNDQQKTDAASHDQPTPVVAVPLDSAKTAALLANLPAPPGSAGQQPPSPKPAAGLQPAEPAHAEAPVDSIGIIDTYQGASQASKAPAGPGLIIDIVPKSIGVNPPPSSASMPSAEDWEADATSSFHKQPSNPESRMEPASNPQHAPSNAANSAAVLPGAPPSSLPAPPGSAGKQQSTSKGVSLGGAKKRKVSQAILCCFMPRMQMDESSRQAFEEVHREGPSSSASQQGSQGLKSKPAGPTLKQKLVSQTSGMKDFSAAMMTKLKGKPSPEARDESSAVPVASAQPISPETLVGVADDDHTPSRIAAGQSTNGAVTEGQPADGQSAESWQISATADGQSAGDVLERPLSGVINPQHEPPVPEALALPEGPMPVYRPAFGKDGQLDSATSIAPQPSSPGALSRMVNASMIGFVGAVKPLSELPQKMLSRSWSKQDRDEDSKNEDSKDEEADDKHVTGPPAGWWHRHC